MDCYSGRDLVVKCAPGIDFDELRRLGFDGEVEVTSYRGSVREACLWSAGLAGPGVRRRASILGVLDAGEQITDAEPDDCPVRPAGRWIVDPDGAVVRAGLVRHYGARHGLWQLDPAIAYLSGDRLPPAIRGFEVLEQLAFDERRLRQALSALDCGALEILVRGVRGRSRRAAATAAAARQPTPVGGDHPRRVRARQSCDGLRLPSLAIVPGYAGGGHPGAALTVCEDNSTMRFLMAAAVLATAVLVVLVGWPAAAAPPTCAGLGGTLVDRRPAGCTPRPPRTRSP